MICKALSHLQSFLSFFKLKYAHVCVSVEAVHTTAVLRRLEGTVELPMLKSQAVVSLPMLLQATKLESSRRTIALNH